MFYAVIKYGGQDRYTGTELAVLDTCDCTVELVKYKDITESGVEVRGFYVTDLSNSKQICITDRIWSPYKIEPDENVYVDAEDVIHVFDTLIFYEDVFDNIEFNVMYLFRFREYIVMRMSRRVGDYLKWRSAVFDMSGNCIAVWDFGKPDCSLAVQIDTISEV